MGELIKPMNQDFSKGKILHESSKMEHFQWGGIKIFFFGGGEILDL